MDISPLPIELARQDPKSDDCLRACALMVFKYFNDPIGKDELWKRLHTYKKHSGLRGGYHQDLGILALKKNYHAEIHHYDYSWWNEDTVSANSKSVKTLIANLKVLKKDKTDWGDKINISKDIKFAKAGGKFIVKLPNLSFIDEYLIKRIPIFLIVREALFYHNPKSDYMHSILVVGKVGNEYIVRDPLYAVDKIHKDELLYAWTNTRGWSMIIYPKEPIKLESVKVRQPQLKF